MDRAEMKGRTSYGVYTAHILNNTIHRDGSIYKRHSGFLGLWPLTRRDETQLEPMMSSQPMNCSPNREKCDIHYATHMMQIFSLKLAKTSTDVGLVQLYGYIAVRDYHDSLLNYVVNRSRDDPIIVEQGSVIGMTGPKRYIATLAPVLVEFDMRIKKGEQEEDDLQLIDGAIEYDNLCTSEYPFTDRINGDCGTVDITLALVRWAFEATIDVTVSKVQSRFDLSLSSFVFIMDGLHEIQLFRGNIGESCGLRRHVIAVKEDTWMHLKFKVGQGSCKNDGDLDCHCSFKAKKHGYNCQQIMLERKKTWV
ncbi:uncharacterized protein [Aegilops tauschii subsp. strangulata]|uniref:uncharacterized protein n=1 Tax=Aegilops tauschii subsp. strangulata TaxID=200361 RepID=UPI003CC8CA61